MPRTLRSSALSSAAPTLPLSSCAAHAAAARRASAPRACQSLPVAGYTSHSGTCITRDAPRASHPKASRQITASPSIQSPPRARPSARADALAICEPGVGRRRTSSEHFLRPHAASTAAVSPSCPVAPSTPRAHERTGKSCGLAAARADVERAVLIRPDAPTRSARGVGYRRTPRERSSRPRAAPSGRPHLALEPPPVTPLAPHAKEQVMSRGRAADLVVIARSASRLRRRTRAL